MDEVHHRERCTLNEGEVMRGLELKKADIIKKKMMLTNKAIEILKKNDRVKVRLPDVNKISLVIENSQKKITRLSPSEKSH